jgi:DNA-directed RNA polymerase subunit E'/Rpb7
MNNMDPLFERRELSKKVHVDSKYIQKNIQASLLSSLRMKFENHCIPEGYIQKNSITIVDYPLGRVNYIKGGVDYQVKFQADVCMPHTGQRFKAPVNLRSKIGIHAETPPIKVLIPRDIHIGNPDFENIKEGDEIEFEVVGTQFKQNDKEIIVVGKLLTKVDGPVQMPLLTQNSAEQSVNIPEMNVQSEEAGEKKVVVTNTAEPKKRKLKRNVESTVNEPPPF